MRVLVVDDHPPTIELMRLTLQSFGHSVLAAVTVADALQVMATDHPDIVLSDLTFAASSEGQDGHGLARAVRADSAHSAVVMIAITGVTSPAALQAALDSGFDEVVQKPFDIESLLKRIEEIGQQTTRR